MVSFQGASIEHAIITEKDFTALCDVMDCGVFRLLAKVLTETENS